METIKIKINDKEYEVLLAKSEEEKEEGLQNVEEMDGDEGMLFDYSNSPEKELSFWMKDTTIPLDIIFISPDKTVISVHKGKPLSEEFITENEEVSYVLELNQNSGIKSGDVVVINDELEDEDDDKYSDLKPNTLYVIGSDGDPQAELQGGERIFSRISSRVILRKAKKAFITKKDSDYKSLGLYVFNEMKAQDERPEEFVDDNK